MRAFCAVVCLFVLSSPAFAGVVFSQRADTFQGAYLSQAGSASQPTYYAFDQFMLPEASHLTGIDWQGISFGSAPALYFVISLYAVTGGSPVVNLYTVTGTAEDSRMAGSADDAYFLDDYSLAIDFYARAKTSYWVSIYAVRFDDQSWGVLLSDTGGHLGGEYDGGPYTQAFLPAGENLAFSLEGSSASSATPEPSGLLLLGTGLVALAFARRRAAGRARAAMRSVRP